MRYLCVFCGSSLGHNPGFKNVAQELGRALVKHGWGLVYGGGNIGLMGVVASTVLHNHGKVIGIIPNHLAEQEVLHKDLTETHIVSTMHERKALMAELSEGFITLPGGLGTLEECCEMVTWRQLAIHQKPCALLNCFGFFDELLRFMDHQVEQGFLAPQNRNLLIEAKDPETLLQQINIKLLS